MEAATRVDVEQPAALSEYQIRHAVRSVTQARNNSLSKHLSYQLDEGKPVDDNASFLTSLENEPSKYVLPNSSDSITPSVKQKPRQNSLSPSDAKSTSTSQHTKRSSFFKRNPSGSRPSKSSSRDSNSWFRSLYSMWQLVLIFKWFVFSQVA